MIWIDLCFPRRTLINCNTIRATSIDAAVLLPTKIENDKMYRTDVYIIIMLLLLLHGAGITTWNMLKRGIMIIIIQPEIHKYSFTKIKPL